MKRLIYSPACDCRVRRDGEGFQGQVGCVVKTRITAELNDIFAALAVRRKGRSLVEDEAFRRGGCITKDKLPVSLVLRSRGKASISLL